MHTESPVHLEFPNVISLFAQSHPYSRMGAFLLRWEDALFSWVVIAFLCVGGFLLGRKRAFYPGRLQSFAEMLVFAVDDFLCGLMGPQGREFVPFIGTLFVYIICMNLIGLVPMLHSATSNLSNTAALALCVFFYVHFTALRRLGLVGYFDHLSGKPRGGLALSIVLPLFMFFMHVISELIKPLTLSLRLRSNIFADDMLLAALSSFGLKGIPLALFCIVLVFIAAVVQAFVFSLLASVYFALFLVHEEEKA